jgi:protein-L-isoaspartate(D-aspartate) O-methyltransferase
LLAIFLMVAAVLAEDAADPTEGRRREMVRVIGALAAEMALETGRDRLDPAVLRSMARVPRHRFVPPEDQDRAYDNRPLPIGHGQTISQPYIVALMTDLLGPKAGARVLEIGTGSGYQAAVLAELGVQVYSIEIVEALAAQARRALEGTGYGAVQTRVGDGYHGWPEAAPFDGILVTAAANHVPPPLVKQLRPGGRMVIPVGTAFLTQHLLLVEKAADGGVSTRQLLPVRFVPLTGGH